MHSFNKNLLITYGQACCRLPGYREPPCLGGNPSLMVEVGTHPIIQNDGKTGQKKYMILSPDRKLPSRHLSIIHSSAASESQIPQVFSKDFPGQPKHVVVGLWGVAE